MCTCMYADRLAQQLRSIFVASLVVMQYWLLAAKCSWSCVGCKTSFVVEPQTKMTVSCHFGFAIRLMDLQDSPPLSAEQVL